MTKGLYCLFTGFLVFIGFQLSLAQSQGPIPGPKEAAYPKQKYAEKNAYETSTKQNDEQKMTRSNTSSIQSLTSKNQTNTQEDKYDHSQKTTTDWWLIVFTGVLACVAIIQVLILCRQIIHYKRTERPYIFVTVNTTTYGLTDALVVIKNHGKTPAILKSVNILLKPSEIDPSQIIERGTSDVELPEGIVIGAGNEFERIIQVPLTHKELMDINGQKFTWLICCGLIRYKDTVNNSIRETSFLWEFFPLKPVSYGISNNKKLNYYT